MLSAPGKRRIYWQLILKEHRGYTPYEIVTLYPAGPSSAPVTTEKKSIRMIRVPAVPEKNIKNAAAEHPGDLDTPMPKGRGVSTKRPDHALHTAEGRRENAVALPALPPVLTPKP